jgi:hypothetical protein
MEYPMDFEDTESQNQVQRLLNEKKKQELSERYGAVFPQVDRSDLPVDVETDWLDHVEEFESQYEDASVMTVREFVGYPATPPLEDIPKDEFESELNQLFGILIRNDVTVHFPEDVDDREIYRFLSEDLLEEEMVDIRVPGMRHCFIYEEFFEDGDEAGLP